MKLAFIGIGNVGFALANNLQQKGHDIIVAHDDPNSDSVQQALQKNKAFRTNTLQAAIDVANVIFLATPFFISEKLLKPLRFHQKTLIDCTNPVGKGISHGLESRISGAEKIQEWAGDAHVVKSYTVYGFENLMDPQFSAYQVKPVMPIAGHDEKAKELVSKLNEDLGFDTIDTGNLDMALHLEHMTLLWVKMVRRDGHHPNFTWAYLEK